MDDVRGDVLGSTQDATPAADTNFLISQNTIAGLKRPKGFIICTIDNARGEF